MTSKVSNNTFWNSVKVFAGKVVRNQLFIPLAALLLLILFNLIADPSFFKISLEPSSGGNLILSGNLISIIDNASELAILAIGMTLVTSASGGQDISVGSAIAIAGSVVLRIVKVYSTDISNGQFFGVIVVSFISCALVAALFGAFNGALVAYFKIQPMVATLILFTAGRSIAAWIQMAVAVGQSKLTTELPTGNPLTEPVRSPKPSHLPITTSVPRVSTMRKYGVLCQQK